MVEAQEDGERARDFAERVGQRILSMASRADKPHSVIIAASCSLEPETLAGRHRLAKMAIKAMGLSGELVLSGSPCSQTAGPFADRVRNEIFTLAGSLCHELASAGVNVSVRFPETSGQSGLRPRSGTGSTQVQGRFRQR